MSISSLGQVVHAFLICDEEGTGVINEGKLIGVFRSLGGQNSRLTPDSIQNLLAAANAGSGAEVRYFSLLAWLFVPKLAEDAADAVEVVKRTSVCPFGVLGTQLTLDKATVQNAPEPSAEVAFVDPAGLHHVRDGGPAGAGGAAGVIYKWLGINEDPTFPQPVRAAITGPLMAKFHVYGERKCIHVIGPDFRKREYSRDEAVFELAVAYFSLLREFAASDLRILRLLPVSGGIFSGPFLPELSGMTAQALQWGFAMLRPDEKQQVLAAERLEMCVFMEKELEDFMKAFEKHCKREAKKLKKNGKEKKSKDEKKNKKKKKSKKDGKKDDEAWDEEVDPIIVRQRGTYSDIFHRQLKKHVDTTTRRTLYSVRLVADL